MADREKARERDVIVVTFSPVSEQVCIAAAAVSPELRTVLARLLPRAEFMLTQQHRPVWQAVLDTERSKLGFDLATVERMVGREAADYVAKLLEVRGEEPPDEATARHHAQAVLWDRQRAQAVQGPVGELVEALRDPAQSPDRVRALARSAAESLASGSGATYLRDPGQLAKSVMDRVRARVAGRACYPFGVSGLDLYERGARNERGEDVEGRYRLLPGAAPEMVTILTALSGHGKTTVAAALVLGLWRQGRKVLYGAWEPGSEMSVELLACISLGYNRADLTEGLLGEQEIVEFSDEVERITEGVRFMDNPFSRYRGEKPSNERNLDTIQQHVEDSGCDVFFADLWSRCLVDKRPEQEEQALFRQQAMAQQTKTHHVLLAQQRLKEVEGRTDTRPTREGIKGSSAFVEVADNILAVHRPGFASKKASDDKLEVIVWKQRHGKWPLVVEFEWDPEFGSIEGGRSLPFEPIGEQGGDFSEMVPAKRGRKKKGGG
jgi:replicative DNA helicase